MPQPAPASETRILVVDDDEIILIALGETLKHEGYVPTTTQSPREALDFLKERPFSVIISDQRMAEMTGLEFLQEAARIQPTASRILITGVLTLKTVIAAINTGEIFRFIAKPWLREELLATIRNATQRHELLENNRQLQEATLKLNAQLADANSQLQQKIRELTGQKNALSATQELIQRNFENSLDLVQRIVSVYHPRLGDETREVTELCERMLELSDLDSDERHILRVAARLHNIGLIGIPRELLDRVREKPESLDPQELRLMDDSILSSQMLAGNVDPSGKVGLTIRACRERWDGKGRPDSLRGDAIPRPARLLAVAVYYVESNLSREDRIDDILHKSGNAFSNNEVSLFIKAVRTAQQNRRSKQVALAELRPGMILARGMYSPSGMLLVAEGHAINETLLEKIRKQNADTYDNQKFFVYY